MPRSSNSSRCSSLSRRGGLGLATSHGQDIEQRPAGDDLAHGGLGQHVESRLRAGDSQGDPAQRLGPAGVDRVLNGSRDLEELAIARQEQGIAVVVSLVALLEASAVTGLPAQQLALTCCGPAKSDLEAADATWLEANHPFDRFGEPEMQPGLEHAAVAAEALDQPCLAGADRRRFRWTHREPPAGRWPRPGFPACARSTSALSPRDRALVKLADPLAHRPELAQWRQLGPAAEYQEPHGVEQHQQRADLVQDRRGHRAEDAERGQRSRPRH